jgi:hypothetical protein
MHMSTFQTVVILKPIRVNQRRVSFAVFRKDYFPAFLFNLIAEFRELGPRTSQRDNALR